MASQILEDCYQEFLDRPYIDRQQREKIVREMMEKLESHYLAIIDGRD